MMHAAGSGETRKFSQAHFTPPEFEFDSFTPGGNSTLARSRWQHCLLDRKTNCMPSSEFRARWLDLQGRTSGFLKIFLSLLLSPVLPCLQSSIIFYTYANLNINRSGQLYSHPNYHPPNIGCFRLNASPTVCRTRRRLIVSRHSAEYLRKS